MLSAYAQDSIVPARVFRGSTNILFFEYFIKELLQHCGKWPKPKSVLVMDNAFIHHSHKIEQMCSEKDVKLVYLLLFLLDLNLIEKFFAKLKAFIWWN